MLKRILACLIAAALVLAMVPAVLAADDIIALKPFGSFCGASIDTTKLTVGEAYTIEYDITTYESNNGGFRVRYSEQDDPFSHNDTENSAHSSATAAADGLVANQVPANFPNETVAAGSSVTLTVNFVLGDDIEDLDPLYYDYICIFGYWGGADYQVDAVRLYDADGALVEAKVAPVEVDAIILKPFGSFCGASIDTTKLTVGASYTIEYNITTYEDNNGGFRVRYSEQDDPFSHNDTENSAHSSAIAAADGLVANQVPANFPNETVAGGSTVTLTVNFVLGADIEDLDPLYYDYIGIFGYWGGADYQVNSVKLYQGGVLIDEKIAEVSTDTGDAGDGGDAGEPETGGGGSVANNKTGDNSPIAIVLVVLALSAAGFIVLRRRVKE